MDSINLIEWHSDPLSAELGVINLASVPFEVKRIYWLSHFKTDVIRGHHAHKSLVQLMVPLAGTLELELFEGEVLERLILKHGDEPVLITPGMWRVMKNASSDAVIMVLASELYEESDYIRDWNEYINWYRGKS